jgi:RNA:NAD 2'-phosphotransferase (TPT1/KptA family)
VKLVIFIWSISADKAKLPPAKRARGNSPLVQWSKRLSATLRHRAQSQGFHMGSDGYVNVQELLSHNLFKELTWTTLLEIVNTNDKKRFQLTFRENSTDESSIERDIVECDTGIKIIH